MIRSQSLAITFVSESAETAASSTSLSVDIDEAITGSSAPYPPGSQVVLRLFGRRGARITPSGLGCSLSLVASGQVMEHSEIVTAIKTSRLFLSYPAVDQPRITWQSVDHAPRSSSLDPSDPAAVHLSGQVKLGVAKVDYQITYDRYLVSSLSGEKALILFEASDGRDCSLELAIQQPEVERKNVTLTLQDYSTDTVIAGAAVTITGPFGFTWTGESDSEGRILLAGLARGDYTILATASGYQNSDQDILSNDRFTL